MTGQRRYITARECARAAGTSVRALRHYEAKGLVKPVRAANGYRHYGAEEVTKVAAIRLLQRLGLSLAEIGRALGAGGVDFGKLLAAQERVLAAEGRRIEMALAQTRRARAMLGRDPALTLSGILDIVETTDMTKFPKAFEGMDMPELTEAQKADLAARDFTAQDQAEVSARWARVFAEAEALVGTDPTSERARAVAREARVLIAWFSGGDKALEAKAGSMWQQAWSEPARAARMPISPEGWAFLQDAQAALTD